MCQHCEWIPLSEADGAAKLAVAEAAYEVAFRALCDGRTAGTSAAYDVALDAVEGAESALRQYRNKAPYAVRRCGRP